MVQMHFNGIRERDLAIDLENGMNAVSSEEEGSTNSAPKSSLYGISNGSVDTEGSYRNAEALSSISIESSHDNGEVFVESGFGGKEVSPLEKKKMGREKQKKKSCKKPPKPPRPPRAPSMDAADQKMVKEISELAMLKRAKIERMKALRRMKNAKSSSSNNNLFALVITVIFCLVIIWQGFFPKGVGSSVSFQGSPESSTGARSGFISVQFYKNASTRHDSSSASPNNVELASGLDDHGKASRVTG